MLICHSEVKVVGLLLNQADVGMPIEFCLDLMQCGACVGGWYADR